jgi:hypothetical protein
MIKTIEAEQPFDKIQYPITGAVMAGMQKTTGLVGLAAWNALRERLRMLYTKILVSLDQISKSVAYRKYAEQLQMRS